MKILIVGASVAGIAAAEALRTHGFEGRIVVAGAEAGLPYDKPPLSKQFLSGKWTEERVLLRPSEFYSTSGIELRPGAVATSVDTDRKVVTFGWDTEHYDTLIVATGLSARRFPGHDHMSNLHSLRTLADARVIRAALDSPERLVIVGGGFIGLEVAATARQLGVPVTVVEPLSTPLKGPLGEAAGQRVMRLHQSHGVEVLTGVGVSRPLGAGQLEALELTDGRRISAQHAVVGIGSTPNTDWLRGSGVQLDDGVLCDETCKAYGVDSVYAIGDVARALRPGLGTYRRVEHWTNAVEQAQIAALAMLGLSPEVATDPIPYFWSDQFGVKLQFVGSSYRARNAVTVDGGSSRSATVYADGDVATGALTWNWPTAAGRVKKLLRTPTTVDSITERLRADAAPDPAGRLTRSP